jgi:hypothetical protein
VRPVPILSIATSGSARRIASRIAPTAVGSDPDARVTTVTSG